MAFVLQIATYYRYLLITLLLVKKYRLLTIVVEHKENGSCPTKELPSTSKLRVHNNSTLHDFEPSLQRITIKDRTWSYANEVPQFSVTGLVLSFPLCALYFHRLQQLVDGLGYPRATFYWPTWTRTLRKKAIKQSKPLVPGFSSTALFRTFAIHAIVRGKTFNSMSMKGLWIDVTSIEIRIDDLVTRVAWCLRCYRLRRNRDLVSSCNSSSSSSSQSFSIVWLGMKASHPHCRWLKFLLDQDSSIRNEGSAKQQRKSDNLHR